MCRWRRRTSARRPCRTTRSCATRPCTRLPSGSTTFAGQADDPFFLDLRVFDLLYGGDLSEVGNDTLKGYNVNSIALQVPTDDDRRVRGAADRRHLVDDPAQERRRPLDTRCRASACRW